MSYVTGLLLFHFGIAVESPEDLIPGFLHAHSHMTLMHLIEPGSYLVRTGRDTGNCFLLVQLRLTDRRES